MDSVCRRDNPGREGVLKGMNANAYYPHILQRLGTLILKLFTSVSSGVSRIVKYRDLVEMVNVRSDGGRRLHEHEALGKLMKPMSKEKDNPKYIIRKLIGWS